MQGSWYKYFLLSLRYYYRSKGFFLFIFKFIIILKLISIFLDIYFGFFPNIFKDSILSLYFLKLYDYNYLNFLYWVNSFLFFYFFFFFCFWFFFRIGSLDYIEISKRKKLKEQLLRDKENVKDSKQFIMNIYQKNNKLKNKIKKLEKILNKYI